MALFTGNLRSSALDMETQVQVMLPQDITGAARPKKTVFLLHGIRQNASSWIRKSNVERYATEHNFALVIPEVQRSFYADMKYGLPYFTYITEELPRLASVLFGLPTDRESLCVAGLSMGGYGAMKCALGRPDVFSAGASLSGAVDIRRVMELQRERQPERLPEMYAICGMEGEVSEGDDLFFLADQAAALPPEKRPSLFACCGSEDFLIAHNRRFDQKLKSLPLLYQYKEWPGVHNWRFWDPAIELALNFFDGEKAENKTL